MRLSKSDFLDYLACDKSFWLARHKPEVMPNIAPDAYGQFLAKQGYDVEAMAKLVLDGCDFQHVFEDGQGLYARTDAVRRHTDGSIDIYEVKSTIKSIHKHIDDFAFQVVAARRSGQTVGRIFGVHLNPNYVRDGEPDPTKMIKITDMTNEVAAIIPETEGQIKKALALLVQDQMDEVGCDCLFKGRAQHCVTFDYFNPDIPDPSIYTLPRISGKKLATFVDEGRYDLSDIRLDEVTPNQQPVLESAHTEEPVVDHRFLAEFLGACEYPLYFLDYETISYAIPKLDRTKPYQHIPFQYSLHVVHDDGRTEHFEYLAESLELPKNLIANMARHIGTKGSVIVWNDSFEKSRNKEMAQLHPEHAEFLFDVNSRTVDLMKAYGKGYVDIAFKGSTSIKNVLPVMAPDLSYKALSVSNGTDAMMGWQAFIAMENGARRDRLRDDLLKYCKRDTYAMVRLFEEAQKIAALGR